MYCLGSKILAHLEKIDNLAQGKLQFPITCEIDTSNYCHNNCKWCIYADYIKGNRVHLDYSLFCKIIDQLKSHGCKTITFTGGGEPLMNPDIKRMIRYAAKSGFKMGLITNGILLHKIFDYLGYFKFIRVSLDATTHQTYLNLKGTVYFHQICLSIKKAVNLNQTDIGISMVYSNDTKQESKDFYKFGKSLGVKYSQVKPIITSAVELLSYELKEIGNAFVTERYLVTDTLPCKIAGLIGQVAANGSYYYCCIHRGKDKYKIGDLNKESLESLVEKRMELKPDLKDCFSCRYMNYAKEYIKVMDDKFQVLRHIDFL